MNNRVLPYQIALQYAGLSEFKGKKDNPIIIEWFDMLGYDGKVLKDETAWCSLFVNICNKIAGYQYTGKLYANSWTEFTGVKKVDEPQLGDIIVVWRGKYDGEPIKGTDIPKRHVGFFLGYKPGDERYVSIWGGNQSNMVKNSLYYSSRIKGFYRPILQASL